ncbi:MAG: 3-dehydroquinate synthase [Lewinellaceae bacterium]|nr:3-dehydroquinate synthase [Saprospiraceae bacterium]MCB9343093.1 3-dehydroquinate synthase [Lewinellaceae bacterium]
MTKTFQLQNCPITLGPLEESFPEWLQKQAYSQVFIIVDTNTEIHCLPLFLQKTGLDRDTSKAVIKAGEEYKILHVCKKIWAKMADAGLERSALVINLGGGVIGDMGGFCAATWKRGIDFVQVPTTLLAMTDAAIGGKVGVDFQGVKNVIGLFQQPTAVFADPQFLKTLPERELKSGYAEVIKHAQISQSFQATAEFPENWFDILSKSIAVKVNIVEQDPTEKGMRMLLNFGHTIGHALESFYLHSERLLTHGEAVAIGMICELPEGKRRLELAELITKIYPHRHIPEDVIPQIWALMQSDKKRSSGKVRMAMPDDQAYSLLTLEATEANVANGIAFYNSLA